MKRIVTVFLLIIIFITQDAYIIYQHQTMQKKEKTNSELNKKIKSLENELEVKELTILPISDDDFIIKDDNNYIELRGKYEDMITNDKIIKTKLADEVHAYDVYIYENFI